MSRFKSALPGRDGVEAYATTGERDAALTYFEKNRPELQLWPCDDLYLAWRWPGAAEATIEEDPRVVARLAARAEAALISAKHCDTIADAFLLPGTRKVLLRGAASQCRGTYYALRNEWALYGLAVEYDPVAEPGTVYLTFNEPTDIKEHRAPQDPSTLA